jgi:hypothetical protein
MDRAQFIAAESPAFLLEKRSKLEISLVVIRGGNRVAVIRPATIPAQEEPMSNLANVVQQLKKERIKRRGVSNN